MVGSLSTLADRMIENAAFLELKESQAEGVTEAGRAIVHLREAAAALTDRQWELYDSWMLMVKRFERIVEIIEAVDNRCMAVDGPVTPTLDEMSQAEISEIYKLAGNKP
jgi:hypothetical protein